MYWKLFIVERLPTKESIPYQAKGNTSHPKESE